VTQGRKKPITAIKAAMAAILLPAVTPDLVVGGEPGAITDCGACSTA